MTLSAANAENFFIEIERHQMVWTVRDKGGFPVIKSHGQDVTPFWSTRTRAQRIIENVPIYSNYEPEGIELARWKETWLPTLETEGVRLGLNWSGQNAVGYDLTVHEVRQRL